MRKTNLDPSTEQRFSSRWGFILSALGIAIGTSNIWRFPRIVAQNGSQEGAGTFIVLWIGFLFLWSIPLIIGVSYLFGIPSARNLNFLSNQDFVWGLALMLSGAFVAFMLIRHGIQNLRINEIMKDRNDWRLGKWWEYVIRYVIPLAVTILLAWWLALAGRVEEWYNPFKAFSLMSCLVQWSLIIGILLLLNKYLQWQTPSKKP